MNNILIGTILEQMFLNKNSNFLFNSFPYNIYVSDKIYKIVQEEKSELLDFFSNFDDEKIEYISNFMTNKCIKIFIYNNQYLSFYENDEIAIKEIYINLLKNIQKLVLNDELSPEMMQKIVYDHHSNLKKFLVETNRIELNNIDVTQKILIPKVCSEYSAEFQINILGIDLNNISEPILDIGCGSNGNLVRYFRQLGLDAYGIERDVSIETEYIKKANWLEYKVEKNKWGTIVSNMAFSNHFFHNHINKNSIALEYAKKYKEILDGLKIQGTFIYAPTLEFIESIILNDYKIEKVINHNMQDERLYTTRITKIK